MSFRLRRVRQCEKCPWKVSTDPRDIPNGYSEDRHLNLADTIADDTGNLSAALTKSPMRVMACHEHPLEHKAHCVGWLMNQLNGGNNIPLRLAVRGCLNIRDVVLDGPQHERFEDTLPEKV